ncbi:hypothetical protein CN491_15435 [Bacillus cereus]|uniref:Uncharacterized protein n=1 Tax=Bacillus cereus TaxID=1396 RepID=A0A2A8LMH8_BACCE|nr:hypothetical protein CN491_15435 [Bacillus cereus]PFP82650.1 hypothetical protein COJ95_03730 [Bacillus cereus]PGT13346.1 hypothetical protein COC96_24415 [Bacillus cereus]
MLFPVYFCKRKAEPTVQPCWLRFFRTEDAFCLLVRKVLRHEGLGGGARQRKAEAARSEQEGIGTPELEALFASSEGVK